MAVKVFDFASAPHDRNPDIVRDIFKFRKKVFTDRENYKVPVWNGMEHDELDIPSSIYLVRYGDAHWKISSHGLKKERAILGMIRLNPTKYENFEGSMIKNAFPDTVDGPVPHGEKVIESTRIGVAKEITGQDPESKALRRKVISELVLATLEVSLMMGATKQIGVMPAGLWKSVYESRDWPTTRLGSKSISYDDVDPVRNSVTARSMEVSHEALERVRKNTGIHERVCRFVPTFEVTDVGTRKKNDFALVR